MSSELITATFYKVEDPNNASTKIVFNYSNMLVVLLSLSAMYFFVGCTLEYTKKNWFIVGTITLVLGLLKLFMGTYFLINQDGNLRNLSQLEMNDEIVCVLVSLRFALMTIFLVGLANWFNRQKLSLVFGLWLVNESLSHIIGAFIREDEILYIVSGAFLCLLIYPIIKLYRIDPIDCGLIVNE